MATYAVGDVQGCYDELDRLLGAFAFDAKKDRLWLVGDLVNRGPKSLEVLRFVRGLGKRAMTVLGNHDLHLVTQHEGIERRRKDDTFDAVLAAPDADELVRWLRRQPMMHVDGAFAMVHAGLVPQWSVRKAMRLAAEVEAALRARSYRDFLANMYGGEPARWSERLKGWDRLRVIVNAMTRLRFCTADGEMDFRTKGAKAPRGFKPWFRFRKEKEILICGHWSTLGLKLAPRLAALDSGCVWGGALSALRLEDRRVFQVRCRGYQAPGGE
ncbi:MAG: symmetrical bis(5'-nucleosyl)-tetraphosphatase [Betaproteobacteria bacterium]